MTEASGPVDARTRELAANLAELTEQIDAAAQRCGRSIDELTVIAVTKTWPADDVRRLLGLGVRDVGENRAQELAAKHAALTERMPGHVGAPTWHFVGRLQRNKARLVAGCVDVVHSVDRAPLVAALERAAAAEQRRLDVFVQVNLDGSSGSERGGAPPQEIAGLADAVAESAWLRLVGLMAVAPLGEPARPAFARLRELSVRVQRDHPDARAISAGMSGDFADAINEGATHLRIGTALLGWRAYSR